jgi:hypothetical protein
MTALKRIRKSRPSLASRMNSYESRRKELQYANLTPEEYERRIKMIAKELKI